MKRKILWLILLFSFFEIQAQNKENELISILKNIENQYISAKEKDSWREKFVLKIQQIIEDNISLDWDKLSDYRHLFMQSSETEDKKIKIYSIFNGIEYTNYNFILQKIDNQKYKIIKSDFPSYNQYKEVHHLKGNDFLIISKMNELAFSCYQAWVFSLDNQVFSVKNAFRKGEENLSVCSFTFDEEGRTGMIDPIKINFDRKKKEIYYSLRSKKVRAKYKNQRFDIKNYDERKEN